MRSSILIDYPTSSSVSMVLSMALYRNRPENSVIREPMWQWVAHMIESLNTSVSVLLTSWCSAFGGLLEHPERPAGQRQDQYRVPGWQSARGAVAVRGAHDEHPEPARDVAPDFLLPVGRLRRARRPTAGSG